MIRRIENGEIARFGLNFYESGGWILRLHRRIHFHFGSDYWGYEIDFRRDHKMYRPADMRMGMMCRRCGASSSLGPEYCGGFRFFKRNCR